MSTLKLKRGSVVEYAQIEDTADISTLYFASADGTFDKPEIKTELHIGSSKVTDFDNMNKVEILYDELVSLRDEGNLIPGMQYRIIDFVTTCGTPGDGEARSAGHPFDLIVFADSETTLNENARVIQHVGDEYFSNSKLSAWEVKYCIDNDTSRFDWAVDDGKGVIYYMKDEFNNECWYDFKNIQYSFSEDIPISGITAGEYYYTFGGGRDRSLSGHSTNNMIRPNFNGLYLNFIVLVGGCNNNVFGNDCSFITTHNSCTYNIFGAGCSYINVGISCEYNNFGNGCSVITLGSNCAYNNFNTVCYAISFTNAQSGGENLNNIRYCTFDSGVNSLTIWNPSMTDEDYLQNIHVTSGTYLTNFSPLPISIRQLNAEHKITIAKNSSGNVKIFCLADLIS